MYFAELRFLYKPVQNTSLGKPPSGGSTHGGPGSSTGVPASSTLACASDRCEASAAFTLGPPAVGGPLLAHAASQLAATSNRIRNLVVIDVLVRLVVFRSCRDPAADHLDLRVRQRHAA